MPKVSRSRPGWPSFTLDQLRSFAAVAAREHVTGAARTLGLSQATVSQQIRLLEDALGIRLVERAGRGVEVTEAGRAVQRLAAGVLDGALAIHALGVDYQHGRRGSIVVGSGHVLGAHRLAPWLARFVEDNPRLDIAIVLDGWEVLVDGLRAGSIDVAVMSIDAVPSHLETVILEETELVVVVAPSHPLATRRGRGPARLSDYRQLAHGQGSGTQELARQVYGVEPSDAGYLELEEGALMAALKAGIGWAAMPRSVVAADCASGGLVIVPHKGRSIVQRFCAVRRRGAASVPVEALWGHLLGIAQAAEAAARA